MDGGLMVTKRTPIRPRARARVTGEMVDLYARGLALYAALGDQNWEDFDRRDEYLDILDRLHVLVGLETWHITDHVLFGEDYDFSDDEVEFARIRAALEAAIADRSPGGRSAR
jgi:hypothetical protein